MSEELRASIYRYFAEIGSDACEAVYQELIKPGGLLRLLRRLSLSTEGNVAAQYASLIRYFRKNGTDEFFVLMSDETRIGPKPAEIAPPVLSGRRPQASGVHPVIAGAPKAAAPAPAKAVSPPPPQQPAQPQPLPKGPLTPGIPPEKGTFGPDTPSWDPDKPHDSAGTWPAVERRSGRERRRKVRRNTVDIIFKNNRFGRDRRSGDERRRGWPKNGHIQ